MKSWYNREFDLQINLELLEIDLRLELKKRKELIKKIEAGDKVALLDYDISIRRTDMMAKKYEKFQEEYKEIRKGE